jgi:hypothetical protein
LHEARDAARKEAEGGEKKADSLTAKKHRTKRAGSPQF